MNNKQAFTLIELLVVVLIIGILAAVALPQYQVAVTKARIARLMPLLKMLRDAQESYYLANGTLADTFDALDIDIPTPNTITAVDTNYGEIAHYADYSLRLRSTSKIAYIETADILLGIYLPGSAENACTSKKIAIVAQSKKVANQAIRSLGGTIYTTSNTSNYYCVP